MSYHRMECYIWRAGFVGISVCAIAFAAGIASTKLQTVYGRETQAEASAAQPVATGGEEGDSIPDVINCQETEPRSGKWISDSGTKEDDYLCNISNGPKGRK